MFAIALLKLGDSQAETELSGKGPHQLLIFIGLSTQPDLEGVSFEGASSLPAIPC
jgi:hypothetical protein